jgi:hypothetical protein
VKEKWIRRFQWYRPGNDVSVVSDPVNRMITTIKAIKQPDSCHSGLDPESTSNYGTVQLWMLDQVRHDVVVAFGACVLNLRCQRGNFYISRISFFECESRALKLSNSPITGVD